MALPTLTAIGTLSKIETRFTPNGKEVTKFQLECSEKNAKGDYENLYIRGEVWEKTSQFFNRFFKNGSAAIVTGKLVTSCYQNNEGKNIYENKFLFPTVSFVPKEKTEDTNKNQYQKNDNPPQQLPQFDINEDEIPF